VLSRYLHEIKENYQLRKRNKPRCQQKFKLDLQNISMYLSTLDLAHYRPTSINFEIIFVTWRVHVIAINEDYNAQIFYFQSNDSGKEKILRFTDNGDDPSGYITISTAVLRAWITVTLLQLLHCTTERVKIIYILLLLWIEPIRPVLPEN
jgi:hypothetical protein